MDFGLTPPSEEEAERLDPILRHFALLNGLLFLERDGQINHIPLTLLPSPFPLKAYRRVVRLQTHVNTLYHKASYDHDFLEEALKDVVELDDFMKNLWQIYSAVRKDMVQEHFLGLIRTDYMLHCSGAAEAGRARPKQVEVNLMAAGLGALSQRLVDTHRLLLRMSGLRGAEAADEVVPANEASAGLARGLLAAWRLYGVPAAVILFVVGAQDRNVFDQRALERTMFDQRGLEESLYLAEPAVRVLRRTSDQLRALELRGPRRRLFVDGAEVAVVYFRHGYSPAHFPAPWAWEVRLNLERSLAIKCPSVQHMLVNSKRMQQVLSERKALRRFLDDDDVVDDLLDTFAGQFDPRDEQHFRAALADPDAFVLKPQREGGGNNYFGADLRNQLLALADKPQLGTFVLMERILPPQFLNHSVVARQPATRTRMATELGVFGVILGNGDKVLENYECGHLMRSKPSTMNEGGVHAGYSCLDSPLLI